MDFSILINKMIVFVVLMLVGYLLAKRGTLSPAFTRTASWLTINVFMCATIVNSGLSANLTLTAGEFGKLVLIVFVMQLIGYLIAALLTRLTPLGRDRGPEFELLMSMGNSMFIALPIVDALFGPVAVFYVSLSCIPFNVLLYTYGVLRLKSGQSDRSLHPKDIISPPLIATLLSLLLIVFHPPMPTAIRSVISSMNGATMPLSMIVIGASLGSVSLLDAFKNGKLYLASAVRLLLIPVLTWLICRFLTNDPVLLLTMVIVAACPSAVVVTVLCVQYGRDSVYTAEGTLQNTVFSMLTIPLIVWLLGR